MPDKFWDNFRKILKSTENFGNIILDDFAKNIFRKFLANSLWIFEIFLFLPYNRLFINWIVLAGTVKYFKALSFYARNSQAQSVLQDFGLSISHYCILIAIRNEFFDLIG